MRVRKLLLPLLLSASAPTVAHGDELEDLDRAVQAAPDDAGAYERYATRAIQAGRNDEAIARLKVGVARVADFARGYYLLAVAERNKSAWADSAAYYRIYIAMRSTETDPLFGLGKALDGLGDKKGATDAYRKYVSLEKRADRDRYIKEAQAAIERLNPPPPAPAASVDVTALKMDADTLRNQRKYDEAVAVYKKALDAAPTSADLWSGLGETYFAQKKFGEAAEAFQQAVTRDPAFALGWYNLAHVLRKADRKTEAVDAYRRYMKLKPDDSDPYYGLGQTLKALGDSRGAMEAFRKYIEMEKRPDEQRWVEKARAELKQLEGEQRGQGGGTSGKLGGDEKSTTGGPADGAGPGDTGAGGDDSGPGGSPLDRDRLLVPGTLPVGGAPYHHRDDLLVPGELPHAARGGLHHDRDDLFRPGEAPAAHRAPGSRDRDDLFRPGEAPAGSRASLGHDRDDLFRPGEAPAGSRDPASRDRDDLFRPGEAPVGSRASGSRDRDDLFRPGEVPPGHGVGDRDEILSPSFRPIGDLRDPFVSPAHRSDLMDPFGRPIDPAFSRDGAPPAVEPPARVLRYGRAVAAYRRALAAHVDDVANRYESGIAYALAGRSTDAVSAWDRIAADPGEVSRTRHDLLRIRSSR